ncbi:hypothetical protein AAG906_012059 [Vitis piasezkii]
MMQRGSQTLIGNIANARELFLTKECLELELQGIKQMVANVEPQKQVGGPGILGDAALHQPVGLPLAIAASSVMAGALGGAQAGSKSKQNGFQSQPMLESDPLTLHLEKMSRNQLNEVISDLKAQIMLGMVTPQVLQMPNIRQASLPPTQPVLQDGQQGQQLAVQTLTGLPLLHRARCS